jgi:hypothetical protein
MPRGKKYGPEEIIPKLRESEVLISQGKTQELAAKQIGVLRQLMRNTGPQPHSIHFPARNRTN